jgi:hypothetical protein
MPDKRWTWGGPKTIAGFLVLVLACWALVFYFHSRG